MRLAACVLFALPACSAPAGWVVDATGTGLAGGAVAGEGYDPVAVYQHNYQRGGDDCALAPVWTEDMFAVHVPGLGELGGLAPRAWASETGDHALGAGKMLVAQNHGECPAGGLCSYWSTSACTVHVDDAAGSDDGDTVVLRLTAPCDFVEQAHPELTVHVTEAVWTLKVYNSGLTCP